MFLCISTPNKEESDDPRVGLSPLLVFQDISMSSSLEADRARVRSGAWRTVYSYLLTLMYSNIRRGCATGVGGGGGGIGREMVWETERGQGEENVSEVKTFWPLQEREECVNLQRELEKKGWRGAWEVRERRDWGAGGGGGGGEWWRGRVSMAVEMVIRALCLPSPNVRVPGTMCLRTHAEITTQRPKQTRSLWSPTLSWSRGHVTCKHGELKIILVVSMRAMWRWCVEAVILVFHEHYDQYLHHLMARILIWNEAFLPLEGDFLWRAGTATQNLHLTDHSSGFARLSRFTSNHWYFTSQLTV